MPRVRDQTRLRTRPAGIVIPDLRGMIVAAAVHRAADIGFTLAVAEEVPPVLELMSSGRWIVADQDPPGQSWRYQGDTVVVLLRHDNGGGEAGDREPRNPLPLRRSGLALGPDLDSSQAASDDFAT